MTRILIIDDDQLSFTKAERYQGTHITQVLDREEFFKRLYNEPWDEVWIDHDLGDVVHTGRHVTRQIQQDILTATESTNVDRWFVITNNYARAATMVDDLKRCGFDARHVPQSALYSQLGVERTGHIKIDDVITFTVE